MKLLKILKDRYFLLLFACILASSILTFNYLSAQTVLGYDQARDAFYAHSILFDRDIKILGPTTDIVGVNHGVLWYYVLAIPYFLAQQDPQYAVIFFYLLSILTIPFVWLLSERLFRDKRVSFVSTVAYSFSPLVVAFSSWMSNPILSMYVVPPLLILIWDYIKKPTLKSALLIGILYGVVIQAEVANLLILVTIPMYLVFFRVRLNIGQVALFMLGLVIALGTFILVELSFDARGIKAVIDFLGNHKSGPPKIEFVLGKFNEFFSMNALPFNSLVSTLLILFGLFYIILKFRENKKPLIFLLIWLSNILLFTLFDTGVSHSSFVFIPSIAVGMILLGFVIGKFIKSNIVLMVILIVIVFFQIKTVIDWGRDDFSPAAIQRSNTILRYKQVVDYTYNSSNGESFIINTVTNPLYINTTWAYLYQYYGLKKYGYMPYYGGRSQQGYLGDLEEKPFGENIRYLIVESTIGMDSIFPIKAIYDEDKVGDLIEEKRFGYIVVQKRLFNKEKGEIEIPQILKNSPVLHE